MEEKPLAGVTILGHKAYITGIGADQADGVWRKKDEIHVWLTFDEPIGSTISFGTSVPVKEYTREQFLKAVKQQGELSFAIITQKDKERKAEHTKKEEKQKELDAIVAGIRQQLTK